MNVKQIALIPAWVALFASGVAVADETQPNTPESADSNGPAVGLVEAVLDSATKYKVIQNAIEDGYVLASGCVSGENGGVMGVHYARLDLLGDGAVDATTPELLVYEPTRWGSMRLVAAEYLVFKEAWENLNGAGTPVVLDGQQLMLETAPNRYGLPDHYELHVWAFKHNSSGMFAPWNPKVTCEYYQPPEDAG